MADKTEPVTSNLPTDSVDNQASAVNSVFAKSDLLFAKIVATPTLHSWSQAYHAGKLFAVLSITKESIKEEDDLLPPLGKKVLNTLEEEYFTLETKSLETIKQAVKTTSQKIPQDVTVSFVVASIIEDIMYVFVIGDGKAIVKRGDKIGTVLDTKSDEIQETSANGLPPITSASGRLDHEDIVILETSSFNKLIPLETLKASLDHHTPAEIAETLSPTIHGQEEGGAAAIILYFQKAAIDTDQEFNENAEEEKSEISPAPLAKRFSLDLSMVTDRILSLKEQLTHSKRMFISLAFILAVILIASVFFALKKQEETKMRIMFQDTITKAQKKYDEGNALLGLNKTAARDDFSEAQKIIDGVKTKFSDKSDEAKQLQVLSKQITQALTVAQAVNQIQPSQVNQEASPILDYLIKNSDTQQIAQDSNTLYVINKDGISTVNKTTGKTKKIISNKDYWDDAKGVGLYFSNIYILNSASNQIIKFVPTADDFAKADYLKSDTGVDLSNALSLGIDTSAWVLLNNGEIKKFTRGSLDSFLISGLEQPLNNPTRIFTNTTTDNIYVLDKGNSRIVVFGKDGTYQSQYQAAILKDAKDFEVLEKQKKIYVLSNNKIWELPLK